MEQTATVPEIAQGVTDHVRVVGMRVDVCDHDSACRRVIDLAQEGDGGYVCVSTVHMSMEARDDPRFASIVESADLVTADGMPMVWMQRLQGARRAARVRGVDLMERLFDAAEKEGLAVGFYGGRQEVLDRMADRLAVEHPRLKVAYVHAPPFRALTPDEEASVLDNIAGSGADILFVGLGCPKQERWMAAHREELRPVMLGVGAAFDFYAGTLAQAPGWIGSLGLEWLYRLVQDPRRLWRRYLFLNPRFIFLATLQLLRLKTFEG